MNKLLAFFVNISLLICVFSSTVAATEPEITPPETVQPEITEYVTAPEVTESIPVTEVIEASDVPSPQDRTEKNSGITSEFICSIVSFVGVVASALIAKNVSKNTAEKEIEKMKLTWEREDIVSSEDDFSKMTSAVARFAGGPRSSSQREALGEIAAVRAKERGDLATELDLLYQAVLDWNHKGVDIHLTNVINEKRKLKVKGYAEVE